MKTIKKEITFIYADSAEKSMYIPIEEEAIKRGYTTKMSNDKFAKGEICFYCEHVNFPEYSKLSLIMLHDIIQQYGNWPDIWFREPWDKYDIGILPSETWRDNWIRSSDKKYSHPKYGVYEVGWPKADVIYRFNNKEYKSNFCKAHGINQSKRTILYAPSWENDDKQNDFVQSMVSLDVNILIKQANWDKNLFPGQVNNIREMANMHRNIQNVTILDPKTNIFEAIAVSDVLVSDESSTMCEAVLMGIPAVSVSDWPVPDSPSGFPKCDYDFVEITTRNDLTRCIKNILLNYDTIVEKVIEYSRINFKNVGSCSSIIMDIVDDCVSKSKIRHTAIKGRKVSPIPANRYIQHYAMRLKWKLSADWAVNNKVFGTIYKGLKFCWYKIRRKEISHEGSAL